MCVTQDICVYIHKPSLNLADEEDRRTKEKKEKKKPLAK
jgi:hypothetical protein